LDDLGLALNKNVCYCKEKKSYIFSKKPDWLQGNCSDLSLCLSVTNQFSKFK
jgi:hypothetical protein